MTVPEYDLHRITDIGPETDLSIVIATYAALPKGSTLAVGVDFGPDSEGGKVLLCMGSYVFRMDPNFAYRLAAYVLFMDKGVTSERVKAVAKGLGGRPEADH